MTYFKNGCWNVVCQVCGFQFKSDQVKKRWDGLIVCNEDFEHRHPMDFFRAREGEKAPAFTSPAPAEIEIEVNYVASTVGVQANTVPEGTFDSATIDDDQYNNITGDQGGGILVE